jgi:hypothetical protein
MDSENERNRGRAISMRGLGGYTVSPSVAPTLRGIPASLQEADMAANARLHDVVAMLAEAGAVGTTINGINTVNATAPTTTVTVPAPGAVNVTSSSAMASVANLLTADAPITPKLAHWQMDHLSLDFALRFGLPIFGYFAWRGGNPTVGGASLTVAAGLWANKLGVIHV